MLSDKASTALHQILAEIAFIEEFTRGMSQTQFVSNPLRLRAVTRCLEIISEASRRLPDDFKSHYPDVAWKEIAGAGNVYRHNYEQVSARRIWETAQSLDALRVAIGLALATR